MHVILTHKFTDYYGFVQYDIITIINVVNTVHNLLTKTPSYILQPYIIFYRDLQY